MIVLVCLLNVTPQPLLKMGDVTDYSRQQENTYQNVVGLQNLAAWDSQDLATLYNTVVQTTVTVLNYSSSDTIQSIGSGVIFNKRTIGSDTLYFVMTNYHVVNGARKLGIITYNNLIKDALLVGGDSVQDLAIIMVTSYGLSDSNLATFASSDVALIPTPQTGDNIFSIGNPSSIYLKGTMTVGIVSNGERNTSSDATSIYDQSHAIQVDLALNPGNSGGPLFDDQGRVIGINSFKLTSSGSVNFEGLNFALSIHDMLLGAQRILASAVISTSGSNYVVSTQGTFFKPSYGANEYASIIHIGVVDRATLKIPETIYSGVLLKTLGVNSAFAQAGIPRYAIIQEVDGVAITNLVNLRKVLIRASANQVLSVKYYAPTSNGYESVLTSKSVTARAV